MRTNIRRKLEMAGRVRDFVRAHPDTNPGHVAAAERLTDRLARAEALAQQAETGQRSVSGAIAVRKVLRGEIADTIALLAGPPPWPTGYCSSGTACPRPSPTS